MNKKNNVLVSKLESVGLTVISLMPESLDEFDVYIERLAIITNQRDKASDLLKDFHYQLTLFSQERPKEDQVKSAFVEASENGYQSVTHSSLVGRAFEYAGIRQILPNTNLLNQNEDRVYLTQDYMDSEGKNMDVYFTMIGQGYSGASKTSLLQKSNYKDYKAVKTNQIYELAVPLIGQYTFRYIQGIKELKRLVYGEVFMRESPLREDHKLTRIEFATFIYNQMQLQTFFVSDTSYYDVEKFYHVYGAYEDVSYQDEDFDLIETITMYFYVLPIKDMGSEFFKRDLEISIDEVVDFLEIAYHIDEEELALLLTRYKLELEDINTIGTLTKILEGLGLKND
jgi:hypothetical protein